jgi:hypothetical protein
MKGPNMFLSSGKIWPQVQQYFLSHVLTWAIAAQLAVGGFAFLPAHMAAEALRSWIGRLMVKSGLSETDYDRRKYEMFLKVIDPFLTVVFLGIAFPSPSISTARRKDSRSCSFCH